MNGKQEPEKSTDRQCKHCGLWFDRRGHIPHQRNCDFEQYDRTIVPLVDDGEGGTGEALDDAHPTPTDDVGGGGTPDGPTPTNDLARTDGAGLGLEGPPKPSTDVDDDNVGCCDDPARRALDLGAELVLEDGTTVLAQRGDELCDACGALVESDGSVRR